MAPNKHPVPKFCETCGAEFLPTHTRQRFCDLHKNGQKDKKPCVICGELFVPTRQNRTRCEKHRRPRDVPREGMRKAGQRQPGYYQSRICVTCGVEFIPTGPGAKYCPDHAKGSWERNNPERAHELARNQQRRYRHKKAWGNPDIYDELVAELGEVCAICGYSPQPGYFLAIDHDDDDPAKPIRGLLCQATNGRKGGCNTGLGFFDHDPAKLRAAAAYLENPPRKRE